MDHLIFQGLEAHRLKAAVADRRVFSCHEFLELSGKVREIRGYLFPATSVQGRNCGSGTGSDLVRGKLKKLAADGAYAAGDGMGKCLWRVKSPEPGDEFLGTFLVFNIIRSE
jgi:hypothetical protein